MRLGLVLSSFAVTPGQMQLLEILVGFGIAGTGFGVILAIVGRAAKPENRSLALGIATAAGSAGQVFGAPAAQILLQYYHWQTVFMIFAVVILCALFALPFLRSPSIATKAELDESLGTVLKRAFKDPSFTMIFVGFFSCGYQLGFITAHFPAFITEKCGAIDPSGLLADIGITTTSIAWGDRDFGDRACQHRGQHPVGLAGQTLYQEIPAVGHLCRAHRGLGPVHPAADDARHRADLLARDG